MRRGRGGGWRGSRVWGRRGTRGRPDLARVRGARQSEGEKVDPAAGALAPFLPARQEAGGSWLRALPGCTTALCGPGGSKHIKRGPSGLQASRPAGGSRRPGGRVAAVWVACGWRSPRGEDACPLPLPAPGCGGAVGYLGDQLTLPGGTRVTVEKEPGKEGACDDQGPFVQKRRRE